MKFMIVLACFIFLFFSTACDTGNPNPVKTMLKQKPRIQKIILQKTAEDAVNVYRVRHNKWPESLDDVQNFPKLPEKQNWEWSYDSDTGKVKLVTD